MMGEDKRVELIKAIRLMDAEEIRRIFTALFMQIPYRQRHTDEMTLNTCVLVYLSCLGFDVKSEILEPELRTDLSFHINYNTNVNFGVTHAKKFINSPRRRKT
jgi:hypothetical protein